MVRPRMRAVMLLIVALGLAGYRWCWPKVVPPLSALDGAVLTGSEVGQALAAHLRTIRVLGGGVMDKAYWAPTPSELCRVIETARCHLPYKPEVWDCDDFAFRFKTVLEEEWAAEGNQLPLPIAVVLGVLQMPDGQVVGHAWNAIVTSDGKLVWVEPQGPQAVRFRKVKILGIVALWI